MQYTDVTPTRVEVNGIIPRIDKVYKKAVSMNVVFQHKDTDGVHEVTLHGVQLPLMYNDVVVVNKNPQTLFRVDWGFGEMICGDITDQIIAPPVKEMTLEEIEEKLGYKVKIVESAKQEPTYSLVPCNNCVYGDAEGCSEKCKDCTMATGLKNFKFKEERYCER